jgi:hypothetical protein
MMNRLIGFSVAFFFFSFVFSGCKDVLHNQEGPNVPGVPTGLDAEALSAESVHVSWTAVSGAKRYIVYDGTKSHSTAYTFLTITRLMENTTYYFTVQAGNDAGLSEASVPVSIKTPSFTVIPDTPQGLAAIALSRSEIIVSWKPVSGAVEYEIGNGSDSYKTSNVYRSFTGLDEGVTYEFTVKAGNSVGLSPPSGPVSVATLSSNSALSKPGAPSGVKVNSLVSGDVLVSWTALSGADNYIVYYGTSADNVSIFGGSTTESSLTVSGLEEKTSYYFAITAGNAAGWSGPSVTVSTVTAEEPDTVNPGLPQTPQVPQGLSAAATAPGTIRLNWTAVSGAAFYKVYRSGSNTGTYVNIGSTGTASYTDIGLASTTSYYYRVSAVNSAGVEGGQSAAVSATTGTEAGGTLVPHTNITEALAWIKDNAENNGSYLITLDASSAIAPVSLSYSGKSNITITLRGISANRVISLNTSGHLFTVSSGVTLILDNGITLNGRGDNSSGHLVYVDSGGKLVLNEGAKIMGNKYNGSSYGGGGGVYVAGSFTMHGGELSGNTHYLYSSYSSTYGSYGGGVYVSNSGNFTMHGGKISGNTSSTSYGAYGAYGGGVYVVGNFTMNDGEISGNTSSTTSSYAAYGGGVAVGNGGIFTMKGGLIKGNTVSTTSTYSSYNAYGGGVFVGSGGTFTMQDGEILNNTAASSSTSSYGGGAYVDNTGIFTMNGGKIGGNAAKSGGGVYVNSTGIFTKAAPGGIIYGSDDMPLKNTASGGDSSGHAVFVSGGESGNAKKRNATAGVNVALDSTAAGNAGGWE